MLNVIKESSRNEENINPEHSSQLETTHKNIISKYSMPNQSKNTEHLRSDQSIPPSSTIIEKKTPALAMTPMSPDV